MYLKRNKMPKTWPVPRKLKGAKYVAVSTHSVKKGIPILIVLRNILKIAKTRKEARYLVLTGQVKINNKIRRNEKFPLQVFDVISLDKIGKNYRLEIVNKKFKLKEIPEKEADKKTVKISGKKILKNGVVQMNLEDGQNMIVKDKFAVNDSVVLNLKTGKIDRILKLHEGSVVEVVFGKHAGERGRVKAIEKRSREKVCVVKLKDKEVGLPVEALLVVG